MASLSSINLPNSFASSAQFSEVGIYVPYAEDSSNHVLNCYAKLLSDEIMGVNLRVFIVAPDPEDKFKIAQRTNDTPDLKLKHFLHCGLLNEIVFPFQKEKGLERLSGATLLCPELLAEKYKGRVILEHVENVNSLEHVNSVRENRALKFSFSNRNLQIFDDPLIEAYGEKGEACLMNTHPAALPDLRGIEGPFWTRYKGYNEYTTTLHVVVRRLDAGPILGYKSKAVNGSASKAVMQYTRDIAPEVARMLFEHTHVRLVRGGQDLGLKLQFGSVGKYSLPTQEQIDDAKKMGIILTDPDEQIPWLAEQYSDRTKEPQAYNNLMRRLNRAFDDFISRNATQSVIIDTNLALHDQRL